MIDFIILLLGKPVKSITLLPLQNFSSRFPGSEKGLGFMKNSLRSRKRCRKNRESF